MVGQQRTRTIERTNSKKMGGVFTQTDDDSILLGMKATFKDKLTEPQIVALFNWFKEKPQKYSFASLHYKFDGNLLYMLCQIENGRVGNKTNWEEVIEEIDITKL